MVSNKKVVNFKVASLFEIYNFCFGRFSIRGHLKNLNFKCEKFKCNFPWIDGFKWKGHQLQCCITFWDLQLLFWLFLHLRSFQKFKIQYVILLFCPFLEAVLGPTAFINRFIGAVGSNAEMIKNTCHPDKCIFTDGLFWEPF